MSKIKVRVDRELCIGAASCAIVAPSIYKIDDQNKAVIIDPNDPSKTHNEFEFDADETTKQLIIDGARSCPVAAIFVTDETGNQIYP